MKCHSTIVLFFEIILRGGVGGDRELGGKICVDLIGSYGDVFWNKYLQMI